MDTTTRSPHELVADEVRAALARRRISGRGAARLLGWSSDYIHRRLDGRTAFDVNDVVALAELLNVPAATFFESVPYGTTTESSFSGHNSDPLTSQFLTLAIAESVPIATRAA